MQLQNLNLLELVQSQPLETEEDPKHHHVSSAFKLETTHHARSSVKVNNFVLNEDEDIQFHAAQDEGSPEQMLQTHSAVQHSEEVQLGTRREFRDRSMQCSKASFDEDVVKDL